VQLSGNSTLPPYTLEQLRRQCERLKAFLNRLRLPKHNYFFASGKDYPLPFRGRFCASDDEPLSLPQAELEYLVGFFDGDGCVSSSMLKGPRLSIGQSFRHCEALLRFADTFGGTISRSKPGQGPREPTVQWQLSGANARRTAKMLGSIPSAKQPQLLLTALPRPTCSRERVKLTADLRYMKLAEPPQFVVSSWAYLAGFFDADGYIHVSARKALIELTLPQKFKAILTAVQVFLDKRCPRSVNGVTNDGTAYRLRLTSDELCRFVLANLLDAGLSVKREVAALALTLTRVNHYVVRDEMSKLTGRQSRYRRLDSAGCHRALEIDKIKRSIVRHNTNGNTAKVEELQLVEKDLKALHALHNAAMLKETLRCDIRSLLKRGAMVV